MYDLHIHTVYSSDGQYTPGEIVEMALRLGLSGISFTDHMDLGAHRGPAAVPPLKGLPVFTGVEISTSFQGEEYHLLMYGFDPDDPLLDGFLKDARGSLWDAAGRMIGLFAEMGFAIEKKDVRRWGSSIPSGVTLLDALLENSRDDPRLRPYMEGPKASSPYMSFYLDHASGDVGRLVRDALPDLVETMRILKGRGIMVLAHPGDASRAFIEMLSREGLSGIEVFSSHHTRIQEERLAGVAHGLGLWVSAGSDFHGERIKPRVRLGVSRGRADGALVDAIRAASGR